MTDRPIGPDGDAPPVDAIDARDFGAKGIGADHDDHPALQRAIDAAGRAGGGTVFLPPVDRKNGAYYHLPDRPLRLRDDVFLVGGGPGSVIRNTNMGEDTRAKHCVLFGYAHPDFVEDVYETHPIDRVEAGSNRLSLRARRDARRFVTGKLIVVLDGARFISNGKPIYHSYLLSRVASVDLANGILTIEHPVKEPLGVSDGLWPSVYDPNQPGKTFDFGNPAFGTQRAGLINLALESNGSALARGGALECVFRKLWISGFSGIYGNLYARCVFEDITCEVTGRAIEIKMGSHDNVIRRFSATYRAGAGTNTAVDFGEADRDNTLDGWFIDYADQDPYGTPITFTSCRRNRVRNGKLIALRERGSMIVFLKNRRGSPQDLACEGNEFSDNVVVGDGAGRYWEFAAYGAPGIRGNTVARNQFNGATTVDAGVIDGHGNTIADNWHEDGRLRFGAHAVGNRILRNRWGDPPSFSPAGRAADLARNTLEGNYVSRN